MLTLDLMNRLWPNGDRKIAGLRAGIVASASSVLSDYGLEDPLVLAHFMAQISHECGAGMFVVENLNYKADALLRQWPSHFTTAQAYRMQHNQRLIANQAYNGRMGNRPGSDDGWTYRGRGAVQTTGRSNYEELGKLTGKDLLSNPDLVNDPRLFLLFGAADFVKICGCLPFARRDDLRGVTQHLNGGQIGARQRAEWLVKWKDALQAGSAVTVPVPTARPSFIEQASAAEADTDMSLKIGDKGPRVKALQHQLNELGYLVGREDGDFGHATKDQVLAFQSREGISTTGVVDMATQQAIDSAPPKGVSEGREEVTVDDLRKEGSTTVKEADKVSFLGKLKVWAAAAVGIPAAGAQSGLLSVDNLQHVDLDSVQSSLDKAHKAYGMLDGLKELVPMQLLTSGYVLPTCVGVAVVGGLAMYHAAQIKKARLLDARSGANMGR